MECPIVCLGEILVDCFAAESTPSLEQVTHWTCLPGGAPANVACGLARLGTPVQFIGAVGSDRWGQALCQLLADLQVGHAGVQQYSAAPTRMVYILLDESGERHFAGFSQEPPEVFADAHLAAEAIDPGLFSQVRYLVLGTLELAYASTRAAIYRSMELTRQQQGYIFVDVNWRPMFWPQPTLAPGQIHDLLTQVDFLKVTQAEAEWLFDTVNPATIAAQLPDLVGVLVTAGAAGCDYWLAGAIGHVPGFPVDVEDSTGAGDAFVAGFLHQLCLRGKSGLLDAGCARAMVTYACAVGALTTSRPGAIAAQPTAEEVDAFLFLHR